MDRAADRGVGFRDDPFREPRIRNALDENRLTDCARIRVISAATSRAEASASVDRPSGARKIREPGPSTGSPTPACRATTLTE